MKSSNIILVTLIGSITVVILAGALQLRFTGSKENYFLETTATIDLKKFRYLVVKESINLTIKPSDKNQMLIMTGHDQRKQEVRYREQGDTLFINDITVRPDERTFYVNVLARPGDLRWVRGEGSSFSISDYPTSGLEIELDRSRLSISSAKLIGLSAIKIHATNGSRIEFQSGKVDTLELHLDRSVATTQNSITNLKGSMSNNSSLSTKQVTHFDLRMDSTSRMH